MFKECGCKNKLWEAIILSHLLSLHAGVCLSKTLFTYISSCFIKSCRVRNYILLSGIEIAYQMQNTGFHPQHLKKKVK